MKKLPLFLFIAAIGIAIYLWVYLDGGNVKIKTKEDPKTETQKVEKGQEAKKVEEAELPTNHTFDKIKVDGIFEVVVTYGNEERVEIETPNKKRKEIQMNVKSGTLYVKLDRTTARHYTRGSKIHVYAAKLNDFTLGGTASVRLNNTLKDDSISIKSGGAASFTGKVEVEEAKIKLDGGSSIELIGTATNAHLDLSGAGKLEGYDFTVNNLTVDMDGLSKGKINCLKSMEGKVSGISKLSYDGNPAVKNVKTSGAASVKAR